MEHSPCLCGANNAELLLKAGDPSNKADNDFNLLRCNDCQMIYTSPRPCSKELSKFYEGDYYSKSGAMRIFYKQRRRKIKGEPGRILDIGSGSGGFLKEMAKEGWESYGIEKSKEGHALASSDENIKVFNKEVQEQKFPDNYFDVVTIWQVLEHIKSPIDVLNEVHRILKDDGILIVAVPNIESLQFNMFKKYWFHLDMPRHLYHFSPTTIKDALNESHFDSYKVEHFSVEYNIFGYIQSFLNTAGFEFNILHSKLKGIHKKGDSFQLLVTMLLLPLLVPVSIFLSLVETMFKRGGTITVFSKKQLSDYSRLTEKE